MNGPGAGASFVFVRNGVEFAVSAQAIRGTLAAPPPPRCPAACTRSKDWWPGAVG